MTFMAKTNKSITKRLRLTKTGKVLRTGVGTNHYQAKKSRSAQLQKKRWGAVNKDQVDQVRAYLKH